MFEAIIFDVDGVMVDTERLYVQTMRQVARRFGREVSDDTLARMMGRAPIESLRIFVSDLGLAEDPHELMALRERMMLQSFEQGLDPMPGLMELLEWARPRLRLAIATGSPRRLLDVILDRLGIADRFQAIQSGDDITRGKPHPEIYQRVLGQLGLPPEKCVVIEDSGNGVRSGKSAGCHVIAVPNEATRGQDFSPADVVVPDLGAALAHLRRLMAAADVASPAAADGGRPHP